MPSNKFQLHLPWWLFLLLAIAAYVSLKYVLPNTDWLAPKMYGLAEQLAPIVTIIFLVLAANGLYQSNATTPQDEDDNPQDEKS